MKQTINRIQKNFLVLLALAALAATTSQSHAADIIAFVFTKEDTGYTNKLEVRVRSKILDEADKDRLQAALGDDEYVKYVNPTAYPAYEVIEFTFNSENRSGRMTNFTYMRLFYGKSEVDVERQIQSHMESRTHLSYRRVGPERW